MSTATPRSFTGLTPVQPYGSPWMGPDNSFLGGSYAPPIGRAWSSHSNLSELYVPPVGRGDGGGRASDVMTRELTDAEDYISTHYAIATQPDNSHLFFHKGFPIWNFLEMPNIDPNQRTYKMFPIYWLNQFMAENFAMAQERLREFVLSTLLDKYPNVLQDLYKTYQKTQGLSLSSFSATTTKTKKNKNNQNKPSSSSSIDDDDDDDNDYEGVGAGVSGYDTAFLDKIWLEFLYKYMPHEDFFFQEINKDTFWLSTMPKLAQDGRVISKTPPKFDSRRNVYIPATSNQKSTHEEIFQGVLESLDEQNGGGGGGGGSGNLFGGGGGGNSHTSSKSSHLPTDGPLDVQTKRFKDSIDKASKTSALITGNRHRDASSSIYALLGYAAEMREQKVQAIKEIREFIYQSLIKPKSHLFSGNTNPLPFLFRGGYHDNFGWLGFVNTLIEDSTTMHSWGQMLLKHQMVKTTLEREQQVYNFWGDELSVGTRLYWAIRRKPNPNFTPGLFDDGDNSRYGQLQKPTGHRSGAATQTAFLNNCDGFTHPNKPWLSGWFGYGAFEIVPIHWGLKEIDQRSLHYVDIFGKKAIAKLIYVGRVKYDYFSNGGYPLEEREIALGRPGISGILPTKEMCKRATGKLPFITVLTRV